MLSHPDFSDEKIEKALFLDIDGVIHPFTQYRYEHLNDMEQLFDELERKFQIDYREFSKYDVAIAYYDWDKDAINEIKRILDATGAKIVVSSSWRCSATGEYLPFLLLMHDLRKYLYGYTPINRCRPIEILEYLKAHPHIKKWVAVDDMDLSRDFPENAVVTCQKITTADADRCIEMLS
ncbi:MAG: HAD domain-containing protein [Fibromonadales bacterium]|nr:HAD domain-containing protein [Fibromonadales bacterium]